MSVKLPVMMVTATLVAGLYVTQSDQTFLIRRASSDAEGEGGASRVEQNASTAQNDGVHLADAARDIRSLQQGQRTTERLTPSSPITPFQLSQLDHPDLALEETSDGNTENDQSSQVDESALRYFAAQGDEKRLAAEIARLRQLYPDWTPPEDPLAVPQNADSQLEAMWQLYAQGR